MFDKFIFFLMVSHPNTFQCILAIIVVAVFAGLYGWPIFLLLGLCVLLLIVSYYLDKKVVKLNDMSTDEELARAEKSSKWLMALLSFFALLGNIIGFFVVLWSLEHDSKSTTTISALFVFQFMFLGIPYILMSFVKRKSSFWYGLMASVLLFSFIQFFVIYFMLESEKPLLAEAVYLSLGDKEERTRNPVMAQVGSAIREAEGIFSAAGKACLLEWNKGNHFKEPDLRTAKAFAWLMMR